MKHRLLTAELMRILTSLYPHLPIHMKLLFFTSAVFQVVYGYLLTACPSTLVPGIDGAALALSRGLGIAALSIGILSIGLVHTLNKGQTAKVGLFTLTCYYIGMTSAEVLNLTQGYGLPIFAIILGIFGTAFGALAWKECNLD